MCVNMPICIAVQNFAVIGRKDVGLCPGDFVLDGDPLPLPKKGAEPHNFRPMFIVAKRLDGSRWHLAWRWPWSSPHCARWGHSSPSEKRGQSPPIFGPSLLLPNSWVHQRATWYGGRPQRRGEWVGFKHIIGHFGGVFAGQMTKPTVSKHWRK